MVVAGGDQHPLLMDIFDVDGDTDNGVGYDALPAVVPAGATPPEYGRFLPADWRDHQHTRQAVEDRTGALERVGAKLFVERLRLEWRPGTPVAELGEADILAAGLPTQASSSNS